MFSPTARPITPTASTAASLITLEFPPDAIVGSLGDLARTLADGTEVPEEFYFACALTVFGALASTALRLNIAFDVEPRLYTVLLGESYAVKKSTAMKATIRWFQHALPGLAGRFKLSYGPGSAEGLAREMSTHPNMLLAYDELRSFVDKCRVKGSTLLPMVTSLFEGNYWENTVKSARHSTIVNNAHLSLIGCCTLDTYAQVWTPDAIAIGLPNRLFIVNADRRPKVAWPKPPDPATLAALAERVQEQFATLPISLDMSDSAKGHWEAWYHGIPATEHARRLETIGYRLLALLTVTTDKSVIDEEVVWVVTQILNYELQIRTVTDPIDADNKIAALEEAIRRNLRTRGALSERQLRQHTHADRAGMWAFKAALKNLAEVQDIRHSTGMYSLWIE